jgi:hypothetical protein
LLTEAFLITGQKYSAILVESTAGLKNPAVCIRKDPVWKRNDADIKKRVTALECPQRRVADTVLRAGGWKTAFFSIRILRRSSFCNVYGE